MFDRRDETRMLCADLVEVFWKDPAGKAKRSMANLEDISHSGACLQMEAPLPVGTVVKISYPNGGFGGTIKYCDYREIGYFLGVEFEPESHWSMQKFKPRHMLDPRRLLVRAVKSAKQITSLIH